MNFVYLHTFFIMYFTKIIHNIFIYTYLYIYTKIYILYMNGLCMSYTKHILYIPNTTKYHIQKT